MLVATAVACGGDDDGGSSGKTPDGGADGQPDAPAVVTNDTESKQSGRIIRAQTEDEAVEGATVTVAGKTATTNAAGDYELIVPRNTPYQMTVAADGFYKLLEQEWILKKETLDRGTTNLLLTATADLLAGLLPGRKADKGLVVVKVNPQPPCASEEGATLTIDPPGEAKLAYFSGSLPNSQQKSVEAGTTFSAAFYNVEVGVPLKITRELAAVRAGSLPDRRRRRHLHGLPEGGAGRGALVHPRLHQGSGRRRRGRGLIGVRRRVSATSSTAANVRVNDRKRSPDPLEGVRRAPPPC